MAIKLGNTYLPIGLFLAPMAGYTDRAMRLVAREWGAEHTTTEMISAKAVVYNDKKTMLLARIGKDEGPVSLQLFGSEPEIMAEAAERMSHPVSENHAAPIAIDINMGCPVKKIYTNGDGSALMRSPEKIFDIVSATTAATSLPVTVKIRAGIDRAHINAVECALAAEEGGAKAVFVHGRTREQLYGGEADLAVIAAVKAALRVPVIANGDITSAAAAMRARLFTGADGIMVGRAAVGNPFVFAEIVAAYDGCAFSEPTLDVKKEVALRQLRYAVADKGEAVAVAECRKQIANYFRGFRGAAVLRGKINSLYTYEEVAREIYELR